MRILELKLRGAIGIQKGLGLEEVSLDFRNFEPGLVALTGRNGSGKTTIMENLHPFRTMVSKDGSLATHFYLKDSYRILTFEYDGSEYRSTILIDALTGKSEAYLHRDGQPLNDGKLTTYDEMITALLGSEELFFNSVFSGQKSKGISALSASERRKLFYELLNLTRYEEYCDTAKAQLRALEVEIAGIHGEMAAAATTATELSDLQELQKENDRKKEDTNREIEQKKDSIFFIQKSIIDTEALLTKLEEKQKQNLEYREMADKKRQQFFDTEAKHLSVEAERKETIYQLEQEIRRYEKILANAGTIDESIARISQLREEIRGLKESNLNIQQLVIANNESYNSRKAILHAEEKKLTAREKEKYDLETKLNTLVNDWNRASKSSHLIDEVPCEDEVGSRCKFLMDAYESRKGLQEKEETINSLESELNNIREDIEMFRRDLDINLQSLEDEMNQKAAEFDQQLNNLAREINCRESELNKLQATNWEQLRKELQDAQLIIEKHRNEINFISKSIKTAEADFSRQSAEIRNEIQELESKIDDNPEARKAAQATYESQKYSLQAGSRQLDNLLAALQELLRQDAALQVQLSAYEAKQQRTAELKEKLVQLEQQVKDWAFLVKAFDKTGIPVLKLENSGIEITSIANDLLSLFENKFRIVFETTALTKDKKKLKETFDINVVEENGVCEISNKSGGQQVWLETAIQLAISLVVRQQGRNIRTSFLDEKDGALDAENAVSYIEMLRKAHDMSGVHNTFVITHRAELLGYIQQQVRLENGYLSIVN